MSEPDTLFDRLVTDVQSCSRCEMMAGCTRVLSWANGPPGATVMFVGEAPGRLGADRTAVPFHGDKSGDNFEKLLSLAGLARKDVFVTNAVLCNPRDDAGNNVAPPRSVVRNCAENLQLQIDAVDPRIVVTLGAAALESTRLLQDHGLVLSSSVRTANNWNARLLIPLYHPGARAMIHRNFSTQTADYYFVGEQARRLSRQIRRSGSHPRAFSAAWDVVRYVLAAVGETSLFRLHKTMYLVDLESCKERGSAITDFFYIRQKDGPYCVELGSRWFKSYEDQIAFQVKSGRPWILWRNSGLFSDSVPIRDEDRRLVDRVLSSIARLDDAQLKTKSYLTTPMRQALRAEKTGHGQLNRPLL
jgi:uracil-DNA glycosylase family 4